MAACKSLTFRGLDAAAGAAPREDCADLHRGRTDRTVRAMAMLNAEC